MNINRGNCFWCTVRQEENVSMQMSYCTQSVTQSQISDVSISTDFFSWEFRETLVSNLVLCLSSGDFFWSDWHNRAIWEEKHPLKNCLDTLVCAKSMGEYFNAGGPSPLWAAPSLDQVALNWIKVLSMSLWMRREQEQEKEWASRQLLHDSCL